MPPSTFATQAAVVPTATQSASPGASMVWASATSIATMDGSGSPGVVESVTLTLGSSTAVESGGAAPLSRSSEGTAKPTSSDDDAATSSNQRRDIVPPNQCQGSIDERTRQPATIANSVSVGRRLVLTGRNRAHVSLTAT